MELPPAAARSSSTDFDRRHAASLASVPEQPMPAAKASPALCDCLRSGVGVWRYAQLPLIMMAAENSPRLLGATVWKQTLPAPADCP